MFCCILKIKDLERFLQEDMFACMLKTYLSPADQAVRIDQEKLFVLTSLRSYVEVKDALIRMHKRIEAQYGHAFEMKCGFAQVRGADLLIAIEAARQLLEGMNGSRTISGMYYYRFKAL